MIRGAISQKNPANSGKHSNFLGELPVSLCLDSAPKIISVFKPNLMIALGGGGYVPASSYGKSRTSFPICLFRERNKSDIYSFPS